MKNFTARLKELRGGMKMTEFAKKIGVSIKTYQHYEKGRRAPSLSFIVALAHALEVSADWLLGLSDTRTPGGATVTASSGSGPASALGAGTLTVNAAPPADTARMEELLETQRNLIATQKHLIETLSNPRN